MQLACRNIAVLGLLISLCADGVMADIVMIGAKKDNTLYESTTGAASNGMGDGFFVGRTNTGSRRRGLVAFDLDSIPAGSTINSVTLRLHLVRTTAQSNSTIQLRRLLQDWGEGISDAGSTGGQGAPSETNDATWLHRMYPDTTWATNGGSFSATSSGSISVGGAGTEGFYTWGSTANMVADVQGWLNGSLGNFGWLLRDGEASNHTSRKFDSRESGTEEFRPLLTVNYTVPEPAGAALLALGALLVARRR